MDDGVALAQTYPAVAATVPLARAQLTALALAAGAEDDVAEAIRLAASEAVTNAVRHAYPDGGGVVHVTAAITDRELWLLIADDGCGLGRRRTEPGLGMGLALMACSANHFTVAERAGGGTEVRMGFSIGARATSGHRRPTASSAPPARSRL